MTDPDKTKKPEGRGGKRIRSHIYGKRQTVSVRMDPDLHQRMMGLCDDLAVPANTYIIGLIEADLKKRKK